MEHITITNPSGSSDVAGIPHSLPQFPLDPKSKDPVVQEAARLHALAAEKTANIRVVREAQSDALRAVSEAKAQLQELVVKGASTGQIDQEAELDASLKVSAAERLADPSVDTMRQRVAINEQREAVVAFRDFIARNACELFEVLRPEAEAATESLVEAEASIAAQRERYRAAQNATHQLGAIVAEAAGSQRQAVSQLLKFETSAGTVPMPSDAALASLARVTGAVELVALDADD